MSSSHSYSLSSRVFWAITAAICLVEVTILALAYKRSTEERDLADQIALLRESTTVVWRMAASPITPRSPDNQAAPDPQRAWVGANLLALSAGGRIHALDGSLLHLAPIENTDSRHALMEVTVRWHSYRRLAAHVADAPAAREELANLGAALADLGVHLAARREAADRAAMSLVALALGISLLAFVTVGTLLMRQTRRFERSGQLMRSMMNQIGAGVCILGSTDKIADANRAACRMLGRPRRELRGRRLDEFLQQHDGVWTGERPDGMPLAVERIPGTIEGEIGPLRIVTLLDVTARHLTAECLQHLANHDVLTGLPNRGFLEGHVKQELARCSKEGLVLGMAVIDLDGFKPVNDTYGHAVGDELLVQVAQRFTAALRIRDLIARTGGDEFVGVFPDVSNRDSLSFLRDRLLSVFSQPFLVRGHSIVLNGSIGLAIAPEDGTDHDSLLRAADAAMYHAKQSGKRRVPLTSVAGTGRAA